MIELSSHTARRGLKMDAAMWNQRWAGEARSVGSMQTVPLHYLRLWTLFDCRMFFDLIIIHLDFTIKKYRYNLTFYGVIWLYTE